MERNKIELIICTLIGCVGLGFAFFGMANGNELLINAGSAISTLFPIFGVFRLFN